MEAEAELADDADEAGEAEQTGEYVQRQVQERHRPDDVAVPVLRQIAQTQ